MLHELDYHFEAYEIKTQHFGGKVEGGVPKSSALRGSAN